MVEIPPFMSRIIAVADEIEATLRSRLPVPAVLDRFPRDFVTLASFGLEIPIVRQPNLTIQSARQYLCALRGEAIAHRPNTPDRPLFGLLHVGPPTNLILLSSELPPAVASYVVAHELGHFFADILAVRRTWLAAMPEKRDAILRAFNWESSDGWLELHALIKGVPDRPRAILGRGTAELPETSTRERQADLIARELLAPLQRIAEEFDRSSKDELLKGLHERFGLPRRVAHAYYHDLRSAFAPREDLIGRVFAPLMGDDGR